MFLFFLIRGLFRGYKFPWWYWLVCGFLDLVITVPAILIVF